MKKLCYLLILLVSFLSATIINVPEDYSTIQAGINASDDGDTVLIAQGIYFENLILQKEIVLTSHAIYDELDSDFHGNENINETIISGPPEPDDPNKGSCLVIRYGDIEPTITGLTFQDGLGTSVIVNDGVCSNRNDISGGAILIYEAYPTIVYNRFLNNGGGENTGGGVVAAVTNGGAISHYDTDDVEFDEDRNSSSGQLNFVDFTELSGSVTPVLENIVESNSTRNVPGTLNIQNNYFEGNSSGDGENVYSHGYDGDIDVSGSVFEDIDCETNTVNEFVLQSIENAADFVQNDISGGCIISNTFYVSGVFGDDSNDGTEEAPLKTIGHALTLVRDAETPTTIYLNAGVYSPSTSGEQFPIVLPDNVELIGDESENTILDAEASANDQAAVMIIKEVENVRVANLTLTGGSSEGHGCTGGGGLLIAANDMYNLFQGDGGTGVDVVSTPLIENVIIEGNHSYNGGGLAFFRTHGPVLNNVIIRNNTATAFGGGLFSYGGGFTMTDVTVTYNQNQGNGQGGGMMLAGTEGTFDNMTITNNTAYESHGGGIWTNHSGDNEEGWVMTNSTISGNNGHWFGGGIMFAWSHPTVINSTISDNTSGWGGGGIFGLESGFTLKESMVSYNSSSGGGGGIYVWGPLYGVAPPVIEDCIVSGNTTGNIAGGIGLEENVNAIITRTLIVDNHSANNIGGINVYGTDAAFNNITVSRNSSAGGGIGVTNGGHIDLTNSIIWDNTGDEIMFAGGSSTVTYSDIEGGFDGEGNIDADPLFTDVWNGDFTINSSSPCYDAGTADTDGDGNEDITDYFGSAPDMGAFEYCAGGEYIDDCGICEGDNSTCTGCTDSDALNYDEENIFEDGSCLYAIEQDVWVSTTGDDSLNTGLDADSPFKTLTNALWRIAQSEGSPYTVHILEGVYSPSITGELFPINTKSHVNISGSGEGVTIIDAEGTHRVLNIIENESISISDLTLTGGFANIEDEENDRGGGIYMSESSPVLTNLSIIENTADDDGGGMFLINSNPTMTNMRISGNMANDHSGGMFLWNSNPTMTNVTISGNTAIDDGGGMYQLNSAPTMTNVTISDNTADDDGGGMYLNTSSPILINSIIWNNEPVSIHVNGNESPDISYSDIEGDWQGEGNIDVDPLFCNPDSGDYNLTENSPCIGTGFEGANMGANAVGCGTLSTEKDVIPLQFVLHQNYPNPFNPVTTLRYDLPEDAMVTITVYNMMGRQVSTLVSSQQNAGYKSVQWNATNNSGQPISAGLYIYTIQAGEFRQTRKMIFLK